MKKEKILTIYCDESGDLGRYCKQSPIYCLSLILLSNADDARPYLRDFHRRFISKSGGKMPFHAGPIIRGEESYRLLSRGERLELFDAAFDLALRSPIKSINIRVKKDCYDILNALSKELTTSIFSNIEYFRLFDRIIFFYDNGQIQLKTMLTTIFNAYFLNFEMILSLQSEQPFMQIADLFATLNLLEYKIKESSLSNSENVFFGGRRMLKKTYLKILKTKSF
ncbi:MAG: DUF3800 domain-containing protein [Bacilli bacterium]|nr:DUF3800 domain-containing protein [Bacilli bacterium]